MWKKSSTHQYGKGHLAHQLRERSHQHTSMEKRSPGNNTGSTICERSHQHTSVEKRSPGNNNGSTNFVKEVINTPVWKRGHLVTTLDPPITWKMQSTHQCGKEVTWEQHWSTNGERRHQHTSGKGEHLGTTLDPPLVWKKLSSYQHTGGESDHLGTTLDAPAVWKKQSTKPWEGSEVPENNTGNTSEKKATNTSVGKVNTWKHWRGERGHLEQHWMHQWWTKPSTHQW